MKEKKNKETKEIEEKVEVKEEIKEEELFIPKTKHKALKIIFGIILIGALMAGGYFLYQYKFNNPKNIISNVIEDAKKNLKKNLVNDFSSDKYKIDGHMKVDANITDELSNVTDVLKNVELQFNGEMDLKDNISVYNFNTKYKNDKLIDIKVYNEKSTVYMLLDGIYDKYIKVDTNEKQEKKVITEVPNVKFNPKETQTIMNSLLEAFKKEVDNLDFKKENDTITVDGKKIDVINNYVELKDNEVNKLFKNIIKNLKDDKNFVETLNKLSGNDIKEALEKAVKEMADDGFKGTYKICFYTDKGLFNKKTVRIRQTITQDGIPVTFDVDKLSDEETMFTLTTMGVSYGLKFKKTNSVINIELSEYIMNMYMKAELSMNYEKINEITKPDVSNSKDVNDLTEKELKEIENKIADNKNLQKIVNELNKNNQKNEKKA